VAQPRPISFDELPTPLCWGCAGNADHPAEYQIDLDRIAPLGNGPANAAVWLRQFAKHDGPRFGENHDERKIEWMFDGTPWRVLPGDDPLLLEAEPWIDQSVCRFYPEVWPTQGVDTPIPNLLLVLDLARSWVARGHANSDRDAAMEDYRRAIRIGRLIRQDDVTLMQDLVGIACIRMGANALYEEARRTEDGAAMVATALVHADTDAMRHLAARRTTVTERIHGSLHRDWRGAWSLGASDSDVAEVVGLGTRLAERRYRLEVILALHVVTTLGSDSQRRQAESVLRVYAESEDRLLREAAKRSLSGPMSDRELSLLAGEPEN